MSNRTGGDPAVQVGQLVRDLRIKKALTQDDLAAELSSWLGVAVHKTMVSKIEKGTRSISLPEAVVLSDILGISMRQLGAPYAYVGITGMKNRVIHKLEALEASLTKALEDAADLTEEAGTLLELTAVELEKNHPMPGVRDDNRATHSAVALSIEVQEALIDLRIRVEDEKIVCNKVFNNIDV